MECDKPSITAILDDGHMDTSGHGLNQDGDKRIATFMVTTGNYSRGHIPSQEGWSSMSSGVATEGSQTLGANETTASVDIASSNASTIDITAGRSNSLISTASASLSSSTLPQSGDQLDVEMRLGTGGSVPLTGHYRTVEFTYFSTMEPVGR